MGSSASQSQLHRPEKHTVGQPGARGRDRSVRDHSLASDISEASMGSASASDAESRGRRRKGRTRDHTPVMPAPFDIFKRHLNSRTPDRPVLIEQGMNQGRLSLSRGASGDLDYNPDYFVLGGLLT